MPIFTAIAAGVTAIAGAIGFGAAVATGIGAVAAFAARTLLTIGIAKLVSNRSGKTAAGASNAGARVQLPPATDNKLPVIYGSAFIGGCITDAMLSTDQKTMWYVITLAEHTDTTVGSGYTYNDIYYDGKLVTFGTGADVAKVVSLTTNGVTPQVDTKVAGNLYMYLFTNGSSSGVNTSGQTAIQILQDSDIPSTSRWTSDDVMSNAAFMIVKVVYNQDAGTTNLGAVKVQLENSIYEPGTAILDYLLNVRYGCAIPLTKIDTTSLTALNVYSAELINYKPVGWDPGDPYAQQERYRIDGPINTGNDCLSNLQLLVDACDSWLQYSELTGKWSIVINQSYLDYTSFDDLYSVDSSDLIGGIEVNPIDLNSQYNEIEVQYPNYNITDQTDYQVVSMWDVSPQLLSPNEPINRLTVQLPIVNNAIQAKYLGLRRLAQGREDLVISFATDYSGIQVGAGDVIKVTLSQYGWTSKLFRVNYVGEQKYPDGSLGARMTAFEYNDTVYVDDILQDFVPEANTGLTDPNIIGTPAAPTIVYDAANTISTMTATGVIPTPGQILYMDFNYGNTNNSAQHLYYTTVATSNGLPYTSGANVVINSTDLPAGNVYWSVTAKNNNAGVRGPSSTITVWPGPSVTTYNPSSNIGGISSNNIKSNTVSSNNMTVTGVVPGSYITANITVDNAGRITSASNGSGGTIVERFGNSFSAGTFNYTGNGVVITDLGNLTAQIAISGYYNVLGGATFDVPFGNAGNVKLPVNVTSTSTRNIPVYIQGTDPGANYYYPYFQGTSSTTTGFLVNSTGPMTPTGASMMLMDDGTDYWYRILQANLSITILGGVQSLVHNYALQIVSDTDNTIVQLLPGMTLVGGTKDFIQTYFLNTFKLDANQPKDINITRQAQMVYYPGIANDADRAGIWLRNLTPGSTVTVMYGQYIGRGPIT